MEPSALTPGGALDPRGAQTAWRRIADGLRGQIICGVFAPGERLPAKMELAAEWHSSSFTLHTALQALVREGWVESVPGKGVYVADPRRRFTCAAIYHSTDIFSSQESAFNRTLHACLLREFARLRKETLIFVESRPLKKQAPLLPALAEAVLHRRVQCVIAPSLSAVNTSAFTRLNLPTAFLSTPIGQHSVDFDIEQMLREGLRRLAARGCRSVGVISHIVEADQSASGYVEFYRMFRKEAAKNGLATREEWIRKPPGLVSLELHGYREFKHLWEQKERPEGLIVHPDTVARGAILAILETGLEQVRQQMRFLFHRNAQAQLLCPFEADWAVSDEAQLAAGLVSLVQQQFSGEKVAPKFFDYHFETGTAMTQGI